MPSIYPKTVIEHSLIHLQQENVQQVIATEFNGGRERWDYKVLDGKKGDPNGTNFLAAAAYTQLGSRDKKEGVMMRSPTILGS